MQAIADEFVMSVDRATDAETDKIAERNAPDQIIVGGGIKKVLYTLNKVRQIGFHEASKALTSKNTCKACGLGMGGQLGGMTNEAGDFPAVCNKSVQAQSTDIQPPIPEEIFSHSINELKELSEKELAELGRLNTPLYKRADEDHFKPIQMRTALFLAAERLRQTEADRTFFYTSGRSSNEAGFLMQLFARLYGTNNINNCSYYCHQATGVALESTIGTGTATVELEDLSRCDFLFLIGANPASNHPRLLHQLQALRKRGGTIVVINPAKEPGLVRFAVPKSPASLLAGGTQIASEYLQPNIGTDYLLLQGIAKAVLEQGAQDIDYITNHTRGFGSIEDQLLGMPWKTIEHCGINRGEIKHIARLYAQSNNTIFAWGMGLTHHTHGVDNIEQVVNLALMRGMIGKQGAGLLPLRGHSNVQGIGTIGVKPVLADDVMSRLEENFGVTLPKEPGLDTMASMQAAANDLIDIAFLMGGNLFASNPNSIWAADSLNKIKTKIFLTTTLNRGHLFGSESGESIIFPVAARDEEEQSTTQESMFNFVRLSDGGIKRLDKVKPESWIISQLGAMVMGNTPIDFKVFGSHHNLREAIAKVIPDLQDLASIDVAKKEFHIRRRLLHRPVFKTSDKKAHFALAKTTAPVSGSRPFTMTTVRSEGQFNSIIYENEDVYRGTKTRWCVMMNRLDIRDHGLKTGDLVSLISDNGAMKDVAVVPFDLPRGNIMTYYPEANLLTGTEIDPRSKTPAFKATAVSIEPVT